MVTGVRADVKTGAACCAPTNQKSDAIQFLRQFFGSDEPTAIEWYNVCSPLIIDDMRVTGEAVKADLESEGAMNIPWTQVADASLVKEVL